MISERGDVASMGKDFQDVVKIFEPNDVEVEVFPSVVSINCDNMTGGSKKSSLWFEGQRGVRYFKPLRKTGLRTSSQNALYWLWVKDIAEQKGEDTKQEVHRKLKGRYVHPVMMRDPLYCEMWDSIRKLKEMDLGLAKPLMTGVKAMLSTTKLTAAEFSEVLREIERDARMAGIELTIPEDVYKLAGVRK